MSHATDFFDACSLHRPRARKPHTCDACGETIKPGQTYTRVGAVYDGTAETIKQCSRCRAIFEAICDAQPREPIDLRLGCGESWEDAIGPCPEHVQALAFALPGESA